MLKCSVVVLLVCSVSTLAYGQSSGSLSALTYQQGGSPADPADPAADIPAAKRRYVCSNGGSDSSDGRTPATAWATVKKVKEEQASIPRGAIVTFCRGGRWTDGSLENVQWGDDGNPTAFGAYGSGDAPRIGADLSFKGSSYFTVRDLDAMRFNLSDGAHDFLVYRNVCRGDATAGYPNNCYTTFGESYRGVFIDNLGYDLKSNDIYVVHPQAVDSSRDSFWFINNVGIGNGSMEDCFDVAQSQIEKGDPYIAKDIKIVGNYCMAKALPGLSKLSGTAAKCIVAGHYGKYIWIVGNVCGFPRNIGLHTVYPSKVGIQISGNVVFASGDKAEKNGIELSSTDVSFYHNTVLATASRRSVLKVSDGPVSVDHNIIYQTHPDNASALVVTQTSNGGLVSMNDNWYGGGSGRVITGSQSLLERQLTTLFDSKSKEGNLNGISVPSAQTYADPRQWHRADFLAHFIPGTGWNGNDGADTPGAFDSSGNRLGFEIEPISGASNSGCGWEGPPIVAAKLADLGVSGSCVGSVAAAKEPVVRPAPPELQPPPQ